MIACVHTVLLSLLVFGLGDEPDAYHRDSADRVVVINLPNVFVDEEVATNLDTGLSTTVVVDAELRLQDGQRIASTAQARVRYLLWDEIYQVETLGLGDRDSLGESALQFDGAHALSNWWNSMMLEIALPDRSSQPDEVRLRLVVLPFSESEEDDARLWFSRSVRRAGTAASTRDSGDLNTFLEQVMATAIRRKKLVTYDLEIDVKPERP